MTNSLPVPTRGDVFAVLFTLLFPVSLTLVHFTLLADAGIFWVGYDLVGGLSS